MKPSVLFPNFFFLVGWLLLMANLEVCSWLWPHLATLGLILPIKLHLIICTHWQMHLLNEVPAFLKFLLRLLGEIHGMSPSKHCQGNRKCLNYNSPFTASILTNTLSKNESQKEISKGKSQKWKKKNFSLPQTPFSHEDGGKRTHSSASHLHSTL